MTTLLETYTGRVIDLSRPSQDAISIDDIAWHLSRIPRFNGATTSELSYSVAQHSVLVLNRLRATVEDPTTTLLMLGLLSSAHKAYMGEVTHPMTELLDLRLPLQRLERRLRRAIFDALVAPAVLDLEVDAKKTAAQVKLAKEWARAYEAYHLMHSKGKAYLNAVQLDDEHILRNVLVWQPDQAYGSFLNHYKQLRH